MKLLQFIKNLLPHIDKNNVIEDARVTIGELDNAVLPSYIHSSDFFKSSKLQSKANKELSDLFYRNIDMRGFPKSNNFITDIYKRLIFVRENQEYVLGLIEELMERDIINEGLTSKKAILLRANSSMSYISRYAIDLLNLVYVNEAIEANSEVKENLKLAPAVIKSITSNIVRFSTLLSDYGIPNKAFSKIVTSLPEVVINTKTANAVSGIYKENDIDPFSKAYTSGFTGSPIYAVRLVIAEWQSNRYKANENKKKMLELRLLHLKMLQEDKNDAKLEQEIMYIQSRVDKISRYLTEVEESLGD